MTRKELGIEVAEKLCVCNKDGDRAVIAVIEAIQDTLMRGESITIVGFGKFDIQHRASRSMLNPIYGRMTIPEKYVPVFNACDKFKAEVNEQIMSK